MTFVVGSERCRLVAVLFVESSTWSGFQLTSQKCLALHFVVHASDVERVEASGKSRRQTPCQRKQATYRV